MTDTNPHEMLRRIQAQRAAQWPIERVEREARRLLGLGPAGRTAAVRLYEYRRGEDPLSAEIAVARLEGGPSR